jgi:NAD(P)-dependent dehydrogenase (short-subunit alcohol dehydrogenase family)
MAYEKLSLVGRVAVVIGGTTGIGRSLALGLTEAGARVVASARRSEEVERIAAEIEARGGWNDILECNLTGTLRGCQIFGRHMLERGYGRIVNIASLSSFVALKEVAAYGVSKAGVAALTKSLAIEWGPRGVNVNAIAPGVFLTDLNRQLLEGSERGREFRLRTPPRTFRERRGAGRGRHLPRVRVGELRQRRDPDRRRGLSGQRRQPVVVMGGLDTHP